MDNINKLVTYGTLRRKPAGSKMKYLGDSSIFGTMWDVGSFPAWTPQPLSNRPIIVSLYQIDDPKTLESIDRYEGCDPNAPDSNPGNLYNRVAIEVPKHGLCWIYAWNGETDRLRKIVSGDWFNKEYE